ncbi:MAG TPA: hypothetical protein VHL98_04750 [Microvirga sp.]|jgi:hypothetical protein|nr:hypothetical protein [Microvirga sp.]
MRVEARRAGAGTLGLAGTPGEPVWYDISLEHDGASVLSFAGAVKSVSGCDFEYLHRKAAVLRIEEGPAIEVTISALEGEFAVIELTDPAQAL